MTYKYEGYQPIHGPDDDEVILPPDGGTGVYTPKNDMNLKVEFTEFSQDPAIEILKKWWDMNHRNKELLEKNNKKYYQIEDIVFKENPAKLIILSNGDYFDWLVVDNEGNIYEVKYFNYGQSKVTGDKDCLNITLEFNCDLKKEDTDEK
ncbi:hypothetical protein M0R19_08090 [Candidatus Pacearchaeota archaeon]|nr:hypothetical protein [Candidatus Pacearchaeota archaeon]